MNEYPNYTLTQLAELILQFETKEGLSPAALANLKEFASSALENASQQSFAPDAASLSAPDDTTGAFDDSIIGSFP